MPKADSSLIVSPLAREPGGQRGRVPGRDGAPPGAREGAATPIEILLRAEARFEEKLDVVAPAEPDEGPAEIPVRPIEVMAVAGSADNVFRALHTLPGVAATEEFGSRLAVRGGGPDENLTIMDGVEIHNPYRLFGLTSAFNPETVSSFELSSGAFPARYGDRLSSLLVVREPRRRRHPGLRRVVRPVHHRREPGGRRWPAEGEAPPGW